MYMLKWLKSQEVLQRKSICDENEMHTFDNDSELDDLTFTEKFT